MAPSSLSKSKRRQKERRETRIADKALMKEQQQQHQQQSNGKKKNTKKVNGTSSSTSNKNDNNNDVNNTCQIQNVTVENLLVAAERVLVESDDTMKAIELYNAAEIIIKRCQQQSQNDGDNKKHISLFLDILERRAEQYMNNGSVREAIEDYKQAIEIATLSSSTLSSTEQQQEHQQQKCILLERMSTYYMNLGQIYDCDEALQSYNNGIQCLEQAITYFQQQQQQQQQNTNSLSSNAIDDIPMNDTNIDIDTSVPTSTTTTTTLIDLQKKLISAYCAAGELYMTDLCDNTDAEEQCEILLQKALQISIPTITIATTSDTSVSTNESVLSSSIEALHLAASHRLSQSRPYDAIQYILQAYETIRIGCEALSTLVGLRDDTNIDTTTGNSLVASATEATNSNNNNATELMNLPHVQALPTFEFRCQTVKLLLECAASVVGSTTVETDTHRRQCQLQENRYRCLDNAIDVLGSLLAENDDDSQVYSLLGDTYNMKYCMEHNDDDTTTKKNSNSNTTIDLPIYYWTRAIELLRTVLQTYEITIQNVSTQDEEDNVQNQIDSIICIIEEIQSKIIEFEEEYSQQLQLLKDENSNTNNIDTANDENMKINPNSNKEEDCEPMEE